MRPPRAAFQEIGLLQPRGPVAPAECYDTCNNANIEAQSVGKSDALCSPDSAFMSYYKACRACIEANSPEGQATTDYLDPQFAEWINFCEAISPIPAGPTSLGENTPVITIVYTTTINGTETSWFLLKTVPAFSARPDTAIITILYTTIIDGSETVWPLLKTLTTFSARPDTAIITIKTSHDGHPTTWTFTTTYTRLHSDFLVSKVTNTPTSSAQQGTPIPIPHPPEVTAPSPTGTIESESGQSTQSSRAWVAGPAIGGVAGVAALILAGWWLLRRKKNKGHEVHGESAIKSELEAKPQPQELESHAMNRSPVELEGHNPETRN